MSATTTRIQSPAEEMANVVTHALGAVLSVVGTAVLIILAGEAGAGARLGAAVVFGASLTLLYASSSAYHAVTGERARRVAQAFDHSAIYVLIAGTYTPFSLITLHGPVGLRLLAVVWSLALVGVGAELVGGERPRWLSAALYVAMGWLVLGVIRTVASALPGPGLWLLVGGGVAYTAGVAFYLSSQRYMHAVWHLFVLAGSLCHFLAIALYVIPLPAR